MANILESPTNIEDEAFEEEIDVEPENFELVEPRYYDDMLGLPQINGVTLTGNKTSSELGIVTQEYVNNVIQAESQARSTADTELNNKINTEATTREQADTALGRRIDDEATARQNADNGLQSQIDAITSQSDVVDVVATYAALQAYDTSSLSDNDVIKVLDDETHEDALTYYRWSTTTQTWTYIGQEAPYYSKGQMDVKLAEKQDKLTAGANIQIQNGTISATDTTYTAGNGLNLNGTEFSADTTVLATKSDLDNYYTKTETDTKLAPKLEAEVVAELPATGTEGKLYLTPKAHTTLTATGNPITATVAEEAGAIESFQLDGDTFQQSYTGKNLVGLINNTISQGGLTATVEGDTVTIDGTATGSVVSLCSANFNLTGMAGEKPAVSIFPISGSWTGGAIGFGLRDSSNAQVFFQQSRYDGQLFNANTLTESALASADHAFIFAGATTVFSNFKFKIMLSDSPVIETTYEPFVGGIPSPNPEYPQPIQTVTGEQTIEIQGKNLFDKDKALDNYFYTSTGSKSTYSKAQFYNNEFVPTSNEITMSFSAAHDRQNGSNIEANVRIVQYDASGNFISRLMSRTNGYTFTLDANTKSFILSIDNGPDAWFDDLQVEYGSTATAYAPYSHRTLPLNLGYIELCKLGTYQDYIYKDGDDWKVHKATAKVIFDGSESWFKSGSSTSDYLYAALSTTDMGIAYDGKDSALMDEFTFMPTTAGDRNSGRFNLYNGTTVVQNMTCSMSTSVTSTPEKFKTWLSTHPATLYYPLYIATDTTITDTTLIAQLEAIRTASLENGANTITNTAAGSNLAGDMEIGYYGFAPRNRYDKWLWLDINNEYEQIGS